jgi:hypothetical protein
LVYGCERQAIISLGLIRPEELRYLPQRYARFIDNSIEFSSRAPNSRRRATIRGSTVPAALDIDPELVTTLSRYVAEGPDSVCAIVAKFINTLVSESALLESHEIDHFILVNGDALSQW